MHLESRNTREARDCQGRPSPYDPGMPRPLILKTGSTYPDLAREAGDFEDWTAAGLGLDRHSVDVADPRVDGLPSPAGVSAAVVTGSHDMVTDDPEGVARFSDWLRSLMAAGVPVLGICYGHQLLAAALGGEVGYHPEGPEIGTVEVELLPDADMDELFGGLPRRFPAQASHEQTVLALPRRATRLGASRHDPNAAVRFRPGVWGVQFHPEFDARVTAHYVRSQQAGLARRGLDAEAVARAVRPSPAGALLRRFAEIADGVG